MISPSQVAELLTQQLIQRDVTEQRQANLRTHPCIYCRATFRTQTDAELHESESHY